MEAKRREEKAAGEREPKLKSLARDFPSTPEYRGLVREALREFTKREGFKFARDYVGAYRDIVYSYKKRMTVRGNLEEAERKALKASEKFRKSDEMVGFLSRHDDLRTHVETLHEIFQKWLEAKRPA